MYIHVVYCGRNGSYLFRCLCITFFLKSSFTVDMALHIVGME